MNVGRLMLFCAALASTAIASSGRIAVQPPHSVWYKHVRPSRETAAAPLVVLHGGPQVPSDYLFDLEAIVEE